MRESAIRSRTNICINNQDFVPGEELKRLYSLYLRGKQESVFAFVSLKTICLTCMIA